MITAAARFVPRYPRAWHVIEAEGAGAWLTAIGLLPAAALFQLARVADHGTTAKVSAGSSSVDSEKPLCVGSLYRTHGYGPRSMGSSLTIQLPGGATSMRMCSFGSRSEGATHLCVRACAGARTEPHRRAYLPWTLTAYRSGRSPSWLSEGR